MEIFKEFCKAGVVCGHGGEKLPEHVWNGLSRKSKEKIAMSYIAFFVDPLGQQ